MFTCADVTQPRPAGDIAARLRIEGRTRQNVPLAAPYQSLRFASAWPRMRSRYKGRRVGVCGLRQARTAVILSGRGGWSFSCT